MVVLNALNFGIKKYISKGAFGALQDKSTFGAIGDESEMEMAYMLSNTFIILIVSISIIFGFIAVNNICKSDSERGKNTRLGLYALLLLSGGAVGWLYILMWILKIDVCT